MSILELEIEGVPHVPSVGDLLPRDVPHPHPLPTVVFLYLKENMKVGVG